MIRRLDNDRVSLRSIFRRTIRRVAINLVGRSEAEWRFRTMLPRCFQQIQGPGGVDAEIGLRLARRPIVRWLRRGMNDRNPAEPVTMIVRIEERIAPN